MRWLKVEVKIEDPWDQRQLVFLLEEERSTPDSSTN